jgi:cytoskeletal protein CcmA (bactofilin family)
MPKEHVIDEKSINTVLAEDISFKGVLKFSTSLMIKGTFEGEIDATGHLVIGPKAVVKAQIKAATITNYGEIIGNVEATEKLEMISGAKLTGDIKTPDLYIEYGCVFNGNCSMPTKSTAQANPKEKN